MIRHVFFAVSIYLITIAHSFSDSSLPYNQRYIVILHLNNQGDGDHGDTGSISSSINSSTTPSLVGRLSNKEKWDRRLEKLKEYKAKHGHVNVPTKHPTLGIWVNNQRQGYKKNKLSSDRVTALNDLDFKWRIRDDKEGFDRQWNKRLVELKKFKETNGHVNVPQKYTPSSLGSWVNRQRNLYKRGMIADERIVALNEVGFVWRIGKLGRVENDDRWYRRLEELKEYKIQNGHVNVPQRQSSLGLWVMTQRRRYKQKKLSPERVAALNEIGFEWSIAAGRWAV